MGYVKGDKMNKILNFLLCWIGFLFLSFAIVNTGDSIGRVILGDLGSISYEMSIWILISLCCNIAYFILKRNK